MRKIANLIKKNLIFNNQEYFLKVKYYTDYQHIKLIFFHKSFGGTTEYLLKPISKDSLDYNLLDNNSFNTYKLIRKDSPASISSNNIIFKNDKYDAFKNFDEYVKDKYNTTENISNLLNFKIECKFTYDHIEKLTFKKNENILEFRTIFYISENFSKILFNSKVIYKDSNNNSEHMLDYKKDLFIKYICNKNNIKIEDLTFKYVFLNKILYY